MNTASLFPPFLGLDVLTSPLLHFLLILKTHSQGLEPSFHNPIYCQQDSLEKKDWPNLLESMMIDFVADFVVFNTVI